MDKIVCQQNNGLFLSDERNIALENGVFHIKININYNLIS